MDFATQYTQTLTVESTSSEHILSPTYFAGVFYDPLDSTLDRLPTVLSGGRIEISDPLSLSYQPLDCRMLLYIEEGGGLLHLRGTEHMLTPGTLLYLDRRSASFTLTIDQSSSRFIVFSLVGGLFTVYESLVPFQTMLTISVNSSSPVLRSLKQLLAGSADAILENKLLDAALITNLLTELFVAGYDLKSDSRKYAPYLKELKHYLDHAFTQPLRLDDLEKRFHMSKYRICREYAEAFGLPPLRYLNRKRLESAETLLLSTEKKVHEIALETGYENTNHFINLFKKEYGQTPQAYRKAHQS